MRKGEPIYTEPIIIVQQIGKREWIMKLPRVNVQVNDRLEQGIDWMDIMPSRAASIFRKLAGEYPEYIDAYHHLALTLEKMGKEEETFETRKKAVSMALAFFPPHFSLDHDRLDWGFVENRAFLRLYHSYGLQLFQRRKTDDALLVFERLLVLSPNDNLGARAMVVGCHFELKEPEGVLSVCRQFPDDAMEQLVYGKPLAFFQLGGSKEAKKALKIAIKCFPLIAAELLKRRHKKPKGTNERRIMMGGLDQAYLYWREQGKYWDETPGAIELLRDQFSGRKTKRRRQG
jgi:tetratricopeptide (TPR) repeat protein